MNKIQGALEHAGFEVDYATNVMHKHFDFDTEDFFSEEPVKARVHPCGELAAVELPNATLFNLNKPRFAALYFAFTGKYLEFDEVENTPKPDPTVLHDECNIPDAALPPLEHYSFVY